MKLAIAFLLALSLMVFSSLVPAVAGATCPPSGWDLKFTAREQELHVVVLPEGYHFCAVSSEGHIFPQIHADGSTNLDAYLPEDGVWRIYGPPPQPDIVKRPIPPRPRPTQEPGSSPGMLPDTATRA